MSPCTRFPYYVPNDVVQTSLVAGYFANYIYILIDFPVIGCINGAQKCCKCVEGLCVGIGISFIDSYMM